MGRRVFIICTIGLLLALFIFPPRYLSALSDEIVSLSEQAVDAVQAEDWEQSKVLLVQLNTMMEQNTERTYLFLSHSIVSSIDASLRCCLRMVLIQDRAQALHELEMVITHAKYLKTIEQCNLSTLF